VGRPADRGALPSDPYLHEVIAALKSEARPEALERLARELAVRHEAAAVDPRAVRHAGPAALAARAKSLSEAARALPVGEAGALHEVAALQERFIAEHADWIEHRITSERVRLGLGDAPDADPDVGCDVCEPLAFLSVELAAHDHPELAERLLAAYAGEANDYGLYRVVDFYERQAALQRAERPRSGDDVHRLLQVARATARRPLLPPAVVALGGMVASGKSTVAAALAARLAAPRIVGDRVREFLEGAPPGQAAAPDQRLASFAPGFEDAAYQVLFADADAVLDSGRTVVLDGGFPTAERRARARAVALRHGVPFLFVECRVAPEVARRRLARRDSEGVLEGPAWEAVYEDYARRWEAPHEIPDDERVVVDTERPLAESVEAVAEWLPLWPVQADA